MAKARLGIRYALPPTGMHRFASPRPLPAGTAPQPLGHPAPDAWQQQAPDALFDGGPPRAMDEDCLFLNLWMPEGCSANQPRPVLVHLFGGGFQGGSPSDLAHDGAALADATGCVVVRIGFRLGALGFLYLGAAAPANLALLDATLALQWVQQHIATFDGDPAQVTVFGLSSGAFMIGALLAMPGARACFRGAWMQSGSASRILTPAQAATVTADLCHRLGLADGDLAGLQRMPAADIVALQQQVLSADVGDRNGPGGHTFGVVLDGHTLPLHPLQAVAQGDLCGHGLLLMSTHDETRLWFRNGAMRPLADAAAWQAEVARYTTSQAAPALCASYMAGAAAQPADRNRLAALRERFLTHAIYRVPALRTALAQARTGGRAWLARFDWAPGGAAGDWADHGSAHAFDEPFVWGRPDPAHHRFVTGAADELALAEKLVKALGDFAHGRGPGWPALDTIEAGAHRLAARHPDDDEADAMAVWSRLGLLQPEAVLLPGR